MELFKCGHEKSDENCVVGMVKGNWAIFCRECGRVRTRERNRSRNKFRKRRKIDSQVSHYAYMVKLGRKTMDQVPAHIQREITRRREHKEWIRERDQAVRALLRVKSVIAGRKARSARRPSPRSETSPSSS